MTPEDFKKLEDLLVKANQSGKQETSGLVDLVIHKMEAKLETSIQKGIETHVNGKIKKIDEKLDAYIVSDNAWKDTYSPYVKGLASVSDGGKIMGKFVIFIGAVGAAVIGIKSLFK